MERRFQIRSMAPDRSGKFEYFNAQSSKIEDIKAAAVATVVKWNGRMATRIDSLSKFQKPDAYLLNNELDVVEITHLTNRAKRGGLHFKVVKVGKTYEARD